MKKTTLKITVEHGESVKVRRVTCYGPEAVKDARRNARAMAPTGSTVIFEER